MEKVIQNCEISLKTFELEDQYAIILGLALWRQEPQEIDFQPEFIEMVC